MGDAERCDLAVWDLHGELTAAVRKDLRGGVRRSAAKIETASGDWHGRRVVLGWPRRLTASQLPTIHEALTGLWAVHRPRLLVVVGPAAAGDSGLAPGAVVWLREFPSVVTSWEGVAREASDDLAAEAILLAAVTHAGKAAPRANRPTSARQAGRWLAKFIKGRPAGANDLAATQETVAMALETIVKQH